MKSYHSLAWKELKAQKIMSFLILAAVILSTMMTTVVGQSIGILQSMREQQAGTLNGLRYVTFHGLTEQLKEILEKDSRLSFVGSNTVLGTFELQKGGMGLQVREFDEKGLSVYPANSKIKEGSLPKNAGEIALPEDALKLLGFKGKIGDKIILDLSISLLKDTEQAYQYQAEFILTGILESNYMGYVSNLVQGIAGKGSATEVLPKRYQLYSTDIRTAKKADFQELVNELAKKMGIRQEYIQYNDIYLKALGISIDKISEDTDTGAGFPFMIAASVLIGVLVLLASGLVIYNILKIAVSKRISQYGTLRAIGARKNQLYVLVAKQLFLLCAIGIPIGAVLGVMSAGGITAMAANLLSPSIFMARDADQLTGLIAENSSSKILPLIISAAITLVFAFAAAIPAARYAAKVSPTAAMTKITAKITRKNRKEKRIRNFESYYARLNLKRNTGRTMITILSLTMSITVFVALQSFSGLLNASKEVEKMHVGDYSIRSEEAGITPEEVETIRSRKDVSKLSTVKLSIYSQKKDGSVDINTNIKLKGITETLQIVGIDEERIKSMFPEITEQQIKDMKEGKACLIKNPMALSIEGKEMEATSYKQGQKLDISGISMDIIGCTDAVTISSEFINGLQIIVYNNIYNKITGKDTYNEIAPTLTKEADEAQFEKEIEALCDRSPDSLWISYQKTDEQLKQSYEQINLLAWGLILFIGIIGLLNIINTTYTNIHTRIGEIGMLRAIGMSTAGLYRTFLWEGAYYSIIATAAGAVSGYICTIFVEAAVNEQIAFVMPPIIPILQAAVISILACLSTTAVPLWKIARMSIVDTIEF